MMKKYHLGLDFVSSPSHFKTLAVLSLTTLIMRLVPAYLVYGAAFDIESYQIVADLVLDGKNVYTHTIRYPYPPVWMGIGTLCYMASNALNLPFNFVVKLPSIAADTIITSILYLAVIKCGKDKHTAFFVGFAYALNPISILITGFHGQFDALPALFSFLAYYYLIPFKNVDNHPKLSAISLGLSVALKGYPIILLPFFLKKGVINVKEKIQYALLTVIPTIVLLLPFLIINPMPVVHNIFMYSSTTDYGYTAVLRAIIYVLYGKFTVPSILIQLGKVLFIFGLVMLYKYKSKKLHLIDLIVAAFIMFYFLSSGIGSQYFMWILPFAILSQDKMFKYYVITATGALMGFYLTIFPETLLGLASPYILYINQIITAIMYSMFALLLWIVCGIWMYKKWVGDHGRLNMLKPTPF